MSKAMRMPGTAETVKDMRQPKCCADVPADEVAEGRADGDGDVEDGEDAVALVFGVEVGEDGGGEDAEGGLADAEGSVAEVERRRRSGRRR